MGFERVGVTSAEPLPGAEAFLTQWLLEGRAGEMDYLERDPARRSKPQDLLPGAQSVIALAMSYFDGDHETENEPRLARYAWGRDYHHIIGKRLDAFVRYLESLSPDVRCKTFVDTGPLLERGFAQRAGLGFVGKNTMVITRGLGSWVFLASVITTLPLAADAPDLRSCGTCRLCIDACPTQAITAPYVLDARRCISYLTIELDGPIPKELRPSMSNWLFGCDICQEVCPHNTRVPTTSVQEFHRTSRPEDGRWWTLAELLTLADDEMFRRHFKGTPLLRTKRHGLLRNACIAAATLKRADLRPALERLAVHDTHPVVREHAAWALEQLS